MNLRQIQELRVKDWVFIHFSTTKEPAQVQSIFKVKEQINATVQPLYNKDLITFNKCDEWEQVTPIDLSENILNTLRFTKYENRKLFGLVGVTYFEKNFKQKDLLFNVNLLWEDNCFKWIQEDSEAYFGCKSTPILYLHILQHLFFDLYGQDMPITFNSLN
jgi:hypothetical protein